MASSAQLVGHRENFTFFFAKKDYAKVNKYKLNSKQ
jgi:hypothetical protein